jgi:acetyl esterase
MTGQSDSTNPFDPALFRAEAVPNDTVKLNQAIIDLMTPLPDWWVRGAEATRQAFRQGNGPFPAPAISLRARKIEVKGKEAIRSRCA